MNPPIMPAVNAASLSPPSIKGVGRLAHKWIDDFVSRGLADEEPAFNVGCLLLGTAHDFLVKHDQCVKTDLRQANDHYVVIVSAMCKRCLHHFMFRISAPTGRLCGQFNGNPARPLHHFVSSPTIAKDLEPCSLHGGRDTKYLNCCGHAAFRCSAPDCSFRVAIEVSLPRLPKEHAKTLTDDEAVKDRLRQAIESNPERFSKVTGENQACRNLGFYLSDALQPPSQRRSQRINVRNIKFAVQFGSEESANSLFQFLGFDKESDEDSDYWRLPNLEEDDPPPRIPAVVPSRQSFFQDLIVELRYLRGDDVSISASSDSGFVESLKVALHCSEDQCGVIEIKDAFAGPGRERPDFDLLGLTHRSIWRIFGYAFESQTRADPDHSHRRAYLEALRRIASPHNQESLNVLIATEESTLDSIKWEEQMTGIGSEGAFNDASHGSTNTSMGSAEGRSSNEIIGEYRNKVQNSSMSPSKEVAARKRFELRSELQKISMQHAEGATIMTVVKEPMELDEALVCLELPLDQDQLKSMDVMLPQALAQGQVEQGKNEFLTGMALKTIGNFLGNDVLAGLAGVMMGEPPQEDVSKEPSDDPNLPAGLDNLRNTCYLNSMLQYFFTINPVRDLVLNFDEYKLPDTEESRSTRRVTTEERGISAKQAYVAKELTNELRALFSQLKSTKNNYATPTQRLALAAMKDTDQLEARYWELETQAAKSQGSKLPGPVVGDSITVMGPAPYTADLVNASAAPLDRAANSPSSRSPKEAVTSGGATHEHVETASNVSSQTLVNNNDSEVDQGSADWNPLLHRVNSAWSSDSDANSMRCEVNEDDLIDQDVDVNPTQYQHSVADGDVYMTDDLPAVGSLGNTVDTSGLPLDEAEGGSPEEQAIARIRKALDDKSIKGTDQEDVQEAMDKMLFNLRSAIKPTGVEPVGPNDEAQTDAITEILRLTRVGYHKAINKTEWTLHSGTTDLFLLAYPPRPGTVGLHEALERGFMREISDNQQDPNNPFLSFSSIRKFPPILHICIQRTVYDQSARAGKKIDVSIQLPQVLYMDRYKESAPGDLLWQRRQKYWDYLELENPKTVAARKKLEQKKPTTADGDTAMTEAGGDAEELEAYHSHSMASNAIIPGGNRSPTPEIQQDEPMAAGDVTLGDTDAVGESEIDTEAAAEAQRKKYEDDFDDLRDHEYHLHAVICHGGSTGASGHYWVWIRDFEHGVWYNYNDRVVRVHTDGEKVLRDLSASDQPYYIAYVRRENLGMVSIPRRGESPAQEQEREREMDEPRPDMAIFG